MSKLTKALTAAAGNAGGTLGYVEDVFSTYLYEGNGTSQTITNGIDLAGEGGLVWFKNRPTTNTYHALYDTERGTEKYLVTNDPIAEQTFLNNGVTSFNSDGFVVAGTSDWFNASGQNIASWTFRKAEKFFDVVTYTGTAATQSIAHNLGSVPGMIIVKSTTAAGGWAVWHNSLSSSTDHWLRLDWTNAEINQANFWPSAPTDSHFTVGGYAANNAENQTLVAYLFASDAGGFGDDGDESIIKCGSFVPASTWQSVIDIGFEPQFILYKKATSTGNWYIHDNMRGINTGSADPVLYPNTSDAEIGYIDSFSLHANGFEQTFSSVDTNTYIYIAIRRPMKTPTAGTEVFAIDTAVDYSTNSSGKSFYSGFPVDMFLNKEVDQSYNNALYSRLTNKGLRTNTTDSEFNMGGTNWDSNIAVYQIGSTNTNNYGWMFKRATGFFDVVAYTGDGTAGSTQAHNLGAAPELMIVKSRSNGAYNWMVYHHSLGNTNYLRLNETTQTLATAGAWNNTTPTDSEFTLGGGSVTNGSGETFIAYLFATLAGVSKVGSYTGTGADLNVDCGFSAGARFILIKRTDSTGDWYVWDSVRGIVAGNDPYFLLNSTAAEVTSTDYIDPLSSGFTVTSSAPAALNASGGTYIFLAIA